MNKRIETAIKGFKVNDKSIPVSFLRYKGHEDTYITYQQVDIDNELSADDELINYVEYYDFDIYSKGNYKGIIRELKKLLTENGFEWQPNRDSGDMYEEETGLYHKTVGFGIIREV